MATHPPSTTKFQHHLLENEISQISHKQTNKAMWIGKLHIEFSLQPYLSIALQSINAPNCHHCQVTENIEHIFLHCQSTRTLWTNVQNYINKLTHNTIRLTDDIKLFGLPRNNNTIHDTDTLRPLNWTLTIARCAIHKSTVDYRTKQTNSLPENLFCASVKTHLQFQHKYYKMQNKEADFTSTWCKGSALAIVNDTKIIFQLWRKIQNKIRKNLMNKAWNDMYNYIR